MPRATPLIEEHSALGGRIIDFAGWNLPVQYTGIIDEHRAVRGKAGLFDIGHMGQIETDDAGALQHLTTNDINKLEKGSAQYSFICDEEGGIVDDLLVYKLPSKYLVVANAVNSEEVFSRFSKISAGAKLLYGKRSAVALQGPESSKILQKLSSFDLSLLKHRHIAEIEIDGARCLVSRSGYTGEDGFEIFAENANVKNLWKALVKGGAAPCGLGARDSLRIEAGLPLYGHELDRNTTPFEAGLSFAVNFEKGDFSGRDALLSRSKSRVKSLIGFVMEEKAVPRQGHKILSEGKEIGEVTSGTFSPVSGKAIGMGYIREIQNPKSKIQNKSQIPDLKIQIRDGEYSARIVPLPFYRRKRV